MKTELEILQEIVRKAEKAKYRILEIENAQRNCDHVWSELVPDEKDLQVWKEDYFPSESTVGYVPTDKYEKVMCLSHICPKCSKKEYFEKDYEETGVLTPLKDRIIIPLEPVRGRDSGK